MHADDSDGLAACMCLTILPVVWTVLSLSKSLFSKKTPIFSIQSWKDDGGMFSTANEHCGETTGTYMTHLLAIMARIIVT